MLNFCSSCAGFSGKVWALRPLLSESLLSCLRCWKGKPLADASQFSLTAVLGRSLRTTRLSRVTFPLLNNYFLRFGFFEFNAFFVVVLGVGVVRTNLVDPASSHMLVSKIKPCMSQYKLLYGETANGSLKQL